MLSSKIKKTAYILKISAKTNPKTIERNEAEK